MEAVRLVRSGWSTRKVARHLGFSQGAIVQWMKRAPHDLRARVILVEIDTIHDGAYDNRLYVYTLLDVHSRWAYAIPALNINTHKSLGFVKAAQGVSHFVFQTIQSDHGPEFSKWFTKKMLERGLSHMGTVQPFFQKI